MNLREALTQQSPSLALQRAAADELARMDAALARSEDRRLATVHDLQATREALQAVAQAMLPGNMCVPTRMASLDKPWPQVARALWPSAFPPA